MPNTPTLTPYDMLHKHLKNYFLSRLRKHEVRTMTNNKQVGAGMIYSSSFETIAQDFASYVEAIIFENTLIGKARTYLYFTFSHSDPAISSRKFRIISEQDPTKTFPFYVASSYEELPLASTTDFDEANQPKYTPNNNYFMPIDPNTFFSTPTDEVKHWPSNIQSVYAMILQCFWDISLTKSLTK